MVSLEVVMMTFMILLGIRVQWLKYLLCVSVFLSAEATESVRYWEQFRQAQPQENTAEEWEKKKKRNMRLVGYCVLTMLISISAHYFGFR